MTTATIDLIAALEATTGTKFTPAPSRPTTVDQDRRIDQDESRAEMRAQERAGWWAADADEMADRRAADVYGGAL